MLSTKVAGKIKTHILCSITSLFRKSRPIWDTYLLHGAGSFLRS